MFAQIGNIVIDGVNSFSGFSRKESATYAQHDVIGQKPILQSIANDLEEINISFHLHYNIANVESVLFTFKKNKEDFEILPFLLGNGRYLGDYVITDITENIIAAFPDGTIIEADLQLTLREFAGDKSEQVRQKKRKNAIGVDKKPAPMTVPQKLNPARLFTPNVTIINRQIENTVEHSNNWIEDPASGSEYSFRIKENINELLRSITQTEKLLPGITNLEKLSEVLPLLREKSNELLLSLNNESDRIRMLMELISFGERVKSISIPVIISTIIRTT